MCAASRLFVILFIVSIMCELPKCQPQVVLSRRAMKAPIRRLARRGRLMVIVLKPTFPPEEKVVAR